MSVKFEDIMDDAYRKTKDFGLSEGLDVIAVKLTDSINEAAELLWGYFISIRKNVDTWRDNDFTGIKAIFESPIYSITLRRKIVEYILTHFEKMKTGAITVLEKQVAQNKDTPGIGTIVRETLTLVRAIDILRPVLKIEEPEELTFNSLPQKPSLQESDKTLEDLSSLLKKDRQVILIGPPGVGKTYYAMWCAYQFTKQNTEGNWCVAQFHQTYRYEDFIEKVVFESSPSGGLMTTVKPMLFVKLCHMAEKNPDKKYVLILDEINRADIPSVFGELLYALEYREKAVRLTHSGMPLIVPNNVYIIATANNIDRGTFEMGVALRRRFKVYMMEPSREKLGELLANTKDDAKNLSLTIFDEVNKLYERRLHQSGIGHLFFRQVSDLNDLDRVWKYTIKPLIYSYFNTLPEASNVIQTIDNTFKEKIGSGKTA
jgi:MoxR-like ATPase